MTVLFAFCLNTEQCKQKLFVFIQEYWIDGTQQVGTLSSEKHCSNDSVNLNGIPRANNDLPQVLCLSLTKSSTATGHKVHLDNCGASKGVICSVPLSGVCPLATA